VPAEIVFVDDRRENLDSVQTQLNSARFFGIPVTTYHYTRATYSRAEKPVPSGYSVDCPAFDDAVLKFQVQYFVMHQVVLGTSLSACFHEVLYSLLSAKWCLTLLSLPAGCWL
jgi:hypothetical protein